MTDDATRMTDDATPTADGAAPAADGAAPMPAVQSASLTPEQRAAAFAGRPPVDRSAALRAGRTPVPRRVVVWIAVAFVVIGLGGVAVEHYFGNIGVPTTATSTTLSPTAATAAPPTPAAPPVPQVVAPLDAFIGLKSIGTAGGPPISP